VGWTIGAGGGVDEDLVVLDFAFLSEDRRVGVGRSLDVSDEDTSVEESLSICIACGCCVVVVGEMSSMRTLVSDGDVVDLLPDLVWPRDVSGVLDGCLAVQNELSVPGVVDDGLARDCFERPCSRPDGVVLSPISQPGDAVVSVLVLFLIGVDVLDGIIDDGGNTWKDETMMVLDG